MRIYQATSCLCFSERTQRAAGPELEEIARRFYAIFNLWHTVDDRLAAVVPIYVHCSLPDGRLTERVMPIFETAARMAAAAARSGQVLIHCYGGRNRSGLVTAMAAAELLGVSLAEGAALVKQARPGALSNLHFAEHLGI